MFTKLATKVESQEMWLPIVFGENPNYSIRQTGSGITLHHCSYGKISLMSNISKYDVGVKGDQIGNHQLAISIGTIIFDRG